jgi:gliding motility-associated-like protein
VANSSGLYWVIISDSLCSSSDSIYLSFAYDPVVELGNDTTIWLGDTLVLDAGPGYNSYLWQDGSTDQYYTVFEGGLYHVTVNNNCGTDSDTIMIAVIPPPGNILGSDTTLILGDDFYLDPGPGYDSYLWQDGSTYQTYLVVKGGLYWVRVTIDGMSRADSVYVAEIKPCLFIPNAFSPDGDGINDYFTAKGNNITAFNLKVCDRHGSALYESNDISQGWDGKYNGKVCAQGHYVYIITWTIKNEMGVLQDFQKSGILVLLR